MCVACQNCDRCVVGQNQYMSDRCRRGSVWGLVSCRRNIAPFGVGDRCSDLICTLSDTALLVLRHKILWTVFMLTAMHLAVNWGLGIVFWIEGHADVVLDISND